jgi:ABC-type bacteriocin/lantibiotic exporter with double-glycine peptidase domain
VTFRSTPPSGIGSRVARSLAPLFTVLLIAACQARGVPGDAIQRDIIYQASDRDCGLAAVAMLARVKGINADIQLLRRDVVVPMAGLNLLQLRAVAAGLGMDVRGIYIPNRDPAALEPPWIAHLSVGHYVVVEQVQGSVFTILDPKVGRYHWPAVMLARRWSGASLVVVSHGR